jgi:cytosine/adenosine deaminase-related metal-dependent hydrolase
MGSDPALGATGRSLLIRDALIVTMNDALDIIEGSVLVRGGRIAAVGEVGDEKAATVLSAAGRYLLPGFVQTHVHLCQTLFRGLADDMPLLEWLKTRVWPLEAAHNGDTLRAATRLAASELLRTGTTCVLTMETVHGTDVVFEELERIGLRATVGKCLMDSDPEAPARLRERTRTAVREADALRRRWHGAANGRLRAAFAPRFAVSCSRELLESVGALSRETHTLVHTHAAESRDEIRLVYERAGMDNVEYLATTGLASYRLCAAHCVHVDDRAQRVLCDHRVHVLHCPGSNLKLGSGIAPVPEMRAKGINVSLGADGAACNNRLDMFDEMRLAATLQAMRLHPGALPARDVVWMATRGGAQALGLDDEIGSIEPGKRADLILVERDSPHLVPGPDPYSTLVYSGRGTDVSATIVDGELLVRDGRLTREDPEAVAAEARRRSAELLTRAAVV